MASIEGIRLNIKKKMIKKLAVSRNNALSNKDFTIISNNCWGGMVYESYNLQKQSPTVGLFFMADEYLKFLNEFPQNLCADIQFINPNDSLYVDYLKKSDKFGSFPIGYLGNSEICFLHYKSEEEVREKWSRRCKRINYDKLIVKMNDQNLCTRDHALKFLDLPFQHKIFFSANDYEIENDSFIYIKTWRRQNNIYASQEPILCNRFCNVTALINKL